MNKNSKSSTQSNPKTAQAETSNSPSRKKIIIVGVTLAIISLVGGYCFSDWYSTVEDTSAATYVGRDVCAECHQKQVDEFHGSHHDLAMDLATDETVLASFDDQSIDHYGVTSKMFKQDDRFMVNTEGPDGVMADFEVKYVFGYEPLQQYMVEFDRPKNMPKDEVAKLQVLRISWNTDKKEWFYLSPPDVDEKLEPGDPLHWTGRTQCWNTSCAECHSTDLKKGFDAKAKIYHTTFSEIDVSCEACHGPGSIHVDLAKSSAMFWDRKVRYGLTVNMKSEDTKPMIETCAKCHSRREPTQDGFRPGNEFCNHYSNHLLLQNEYHADGQIKDEDYVYGSFIQSKMYHKGIRCSDCHNPHTARVKEQGNKLCTSCHQHPAGKYDAPAHHQHQVGSTGAQCVECHMPETVYMEVDPRRDHSIRIPRPDLSVKIGTPNACTQCHIDKEKLPQEDREGLTQYLDWLVKADQGDDVIKAELARIDQEMLDAVEKWYGSKDHPQSFAEVFSAVRGGDEEALDDLRKLAVNQNVAGIVRATAAFELSSFYDESSLKTAIQALTDEDPTVVNAALYRIQNQLRVVGQAASVAQSEQDVNRLYSPLADHITHLLYSESHLVRTHAARALASFPASVRDVMGKEERDAFKEALKEFEESLMLSNDHSRAYAVLGSLYEEMGEINRAVQAYRDGIRIEPNVDGPRRNLAAIFDRQAAELEQQIKNAYQAQQQEHASDIAVKMLELQKASAQLRAEELKIVEHNVSLMPESTPGLDGLLYDYAMMLTANNRLPDAKDALLRAYKLDPENIMYIETVGAMYDKLLEFDLAIEFANKALKLEPGNPRYVAWVQQLRQKKQQIEQLPPPTPQQPPIPLRPNPEPPK